MSERPPADELRVLTPALPASSFDAVPVKTRPDASLINTPPRHDNSHCRPFPLLFRLLPVQPLSSFSTLHLLHHCYVIPRRAITRSASSLRAQKDATTD